MLAIIDTLSQAGEIKESGLEIGVIMSKKVSVISFYYITASTRTKKPTPVSEQLTKLPRGL